MTPPPARRVAVRRERGPLRMRAVVTQVVTKRLGALPVVAEFLHRLQVAQTVDGLCPVRDLALATHGEVIEALVANRLTSPRTLVRVEDWARTCAVKEVMELDPGLLNDDRLGRALDAIAPRLDEITGSIAARAICEFGIDNATLHWDMTSVSLTGAFDSDDQDPDYPRVAYGHPKDRRVDLKQIQAGLGVSADGAVPLLATAVSGQSGEITQVVSAIARFQKTAAVKRFLMIGDSKLVSLGGGLSRHPPGARRRTADGQHICRPRLARPCLRLRRLRGRLRDGRPPTPADHPVRRGPAGPERHRGGPGAQPHEGHPAGRAAHPGRHRQAPRRQHGEPRAVLAAPARVVQHRAGQTKTVTYTATSGTQDSSSNEETVNKSVSASASAGWGPISASVSAALSTSSTTSQQVTVTTQTTSFVANEYENKNDYPEMLLFWQLVDVVTVFDPDGNPLSSIVSGTQPVVISGPWNVDEIKKPPVEPAAVHTVGTRPTLASLEPAPHPSS